MRIPKWLKWFLGTLSALVLGIFLLIQILSESKPVGKTGPEADALANKMLTAIDHPGWDTTGAVQWTFKSVHDFLWDKKRNLVKVNWDNYEVLVVLDQTTGRAWENGVEVTGPAGDKLVKTAWSHFCNDSFWLNAPAKIFDPGTERRIVELPDGSQGLMITYTSGGVTPGDSYLWYLEDNGLPKSYKMWVSIIPVGGMEFTWENWSTLSTGAKIATFHKSKVLELDISNLKGAPDLSAMGLSEDPFEPIL